MVCHWVDAHALQSQSKLNCCCLYRTGVDVDSAGVGDGGDVAPTTKDNGIQCVV